MRGKIHEAATLRQIQGVVYILCHIMHTVGGYPSNVPVPFFSLPPVIPRYRQPVNIIDVAENIRISVGDRPGVFPTSRLLRGAGSLVVSLLTVDNRDRDIGIRWNLLIDRCERSPRLLTWATPRGRVTSALHDCRHKSPVTCRKQKLKQHLGMWLL